MRRITRIDAGLVAEPRRHEANASRAAAVSVDINAVRDAMTVQGMIKTPMVVADNTRTGRNTAVHQMQLAGLEPMVDTVTESF
jgi:hypothetical protein